MVKISIENLKYNNEIAKDLESLDETQLYAVQAYVELYGDDIDCVMDAIEFARREDYNIFYDCYDMEDVAYHIINESGIYDLPEIAKTYFDYESFGRDLAIESNFIFLDGGICVELLN